MSPNEYDELAKQLEEQLNQAGTLIRFRVLNHVEYCLKFNLSIETTFLDMLTIEWRIAIEKKALEGTSQIPCEMIADSVDVIDFVTGQAINLIAHAIAHPNEVKTAKIVVT